MTEIHGYKLDSELDSIPDEVLLFAPLDVDCTVRRASRLSAKAVARKYGYQGSGPPIRFLERKLRQWTKARDTAEECLRRGDASQAKDKLGDVDHPWIKFVRYSETKAILNKIREFQKRHHVADGYAAAGVKSSFARIYIWYDA